VRVSRIRARALLTFAISSWPRGDKARPFGRP